MAENNEADPKIKASDPKGDSVVAPIQDPMSFRDTDTGNLKRLTPGKAKKTIKLKPLTAKSSATKVPTSKPDETQQGIGSKTSASDVKTATAVSQLVPNASATGKQTIKLKTGGTGGESSKSAILKPAGLKPVTGKSAVLKKPGAATASTPAAPKPAAPDSPTVNLTGAAKAAAAPKAPAPAPAAAAPKAISPKPLTPKTGLTPVTPSEPKSEEAPKAVVPPKPMAPKAPAPAAAKMPASAPASPKMPSPASPKMPAPASPKMPPPASPKMPEPAAAAPKGPGLALPKNALGDEEEAKPAGEEDQFEKELKNIKSKKKKGKKQAAESDDKVEPGIILSLCSWAAMLFVGLAVTLCAIQFVNQWHNQSIKIPGLENIAEVKFFNKGSASAETPAPQKEDAKSTKTEKKK